MNVAVFDVSLEPMLADILRESRKRGYVPPLTLALVGRDGTGTIVRCIPPDGRFEPVELAQELARQVDATQWEFPLNIMVADSRGEGSVVTLRAEQFSKH